MDPKKKKKYGVSVSFTREVEAENDAEAIRKIAGELTYSSATEEATNISISCYAMPSLPGLRGANEALGQPTEAEPAIPDAREFLVPEAPKAVTATSEDDPVFF